MLIIKRGGALSLNHCSNPANTHTQVTDMLYHPAKQTLTEVMSSKRGWISSEAGLRRVFARSDWRYTDCKETLTHTRPFSFSLPFARPLQPPTNTVAYCSTLHGTVHGVIVRPLSPLTQSQKNKNKNVKVQSGGGRTHTSSPLLVNSRVLD